MKKTILQILLSLNIIFLNQPLLSICDTQWIDTALLVTGAFLFTYHSILMIHLKHCLNNVKKFNKGKLNINSSIFQTTEQVINYALTKSFKYMIAGLIMSGVGLYRSCKY